jgi:hypothetical protein
VGLIGQMVPSFIRDWQSGLARFTESNPHFSEFNHLGQPVFAGWIFNGFDTARRRRTPDEIAAGAPLGQKEMNQADETMHNRITQAVQTELVDVIGRQITTYNSIAKVPVSNFRIGDIEDANVLIQNSLWLNVPLGQLEHHKQVVSLRDRSQWADNQIEQIRLFRQKFEETATFVEKICV